LLMICNIARLGLCSDGCGLALKQRGSI
jgi:hypothetical protein